MVTIYYNLNEDCDSKRRGVLFQKCMEGYGWAVIAHLRYLLRCELGLGMMMLIRVHRDLDLVKELGF